jgi:integrative and conjugative element protein (TIGR02256 family)
MGRLSAEAWPTETGGVLIGHYTADHRCALVSQVLPAPSDSHSGPAWFHRGVAGLQQELESLWQNQGWYYLGEWHLHPGGVPLPSATDYRQMHAIATDEQYKCPEPLLLVLAGAPSQSWRLGVFVFPRGGAHVQLQATHHRE